MTTKSRSKPKSKPAKSAARKTQFDTEKIEAGEVDQDRADVDKSLEKLKAERDKYKSQVTSIKTKLSKAQNKVREAELDFEKADKHRKSCKSALDKAISDELGIVNRFVHGEQDLPFPDPDKPGEPSATSTAAPVGSDHAANESIDALLQKNIKKIVGAEAFDKAKNSSNPIGMTEKQLDILKAGDIKTIGDLENKMKADEWWYRKLKGFGETKITLLSDTHLAYRLIYPPPSEPETHETGPAAGLTTAEVQQSFSEATPNAEPAKEAAATETTAA